MGDGRDRGVYGWLILLCTFLKISSGSAVDVCFPNPCMNGATCVRSPQGNSHICTCAAGYEGYDCSQEKNRCYPNPCNNDGQCTNFRTFYTCKCEGSWSGPNCDKAELTQPVHTFAPSDVRLGTATDVMTRDNEGDTYGISEAWQTGIIVAVVLFSALVMIVTGFLGWFLPKSQIIPSASSSRHMERIHRNNTPRRQGGYMSLLKKRLLERITENNLNSRRDLNDVKKFVHKNNIPMPDFTAARRLNNGTFYGRDTTYISISKRNGIAYLEMIRPEGAPVPSRLKRCNIELEQVAMRSDNETVQGEPQLLPPLPPSPPPSPSPSPPPPPSSSSPPSASPSPLPTPSPPSPQQLEQSPPTAQRSEEHSQDQSEQQPVAEQRQQQSEPQ
ncbi:uncharacterized protein LOC102807825 [Saccoglossus kowalevskii]